jgi:hypothetical protein
MSDSRDIIVSSRPSTSNDDSSLTLLSTIRFPPRLRRWPRSYAQLNIYDFNDVPASGFLAWMKIGIHHSAVQIGQKEWTFSDQVRARFGLCVILCRARVTVRVRRESYQTDAFEMSLIDSTPSSSVDRPPPTPLHTHAHKHAYATAGRLHDARPGGTALHAA